jgi:hypothetical protein
MEIQETNLVGVIQHSIGDDIDGASKEKTKANT